MGRVTLRSGEVLTVVEATPGRWKDLARLFGDNGACGGCWCMWWRLSRPEFDRRKGARNRAALQRLVRSGRVPGLLGYVEGKPVGWVAVEPRGAYAALARARTLKPVDDRPAWSVTCFFIDRAWRGKGLSGALLGEAVAHARRRGARLVEGYPVDTRGAWADAWMFTGRLGTFRAQGFEEVARRSKTRPLVRLELGRAPATSRRAARGR